MLVLILIIDTTLLSLLDVEANQTQEAYEGPDCYDGSTFLLNQSLIIYVTDPVDHQQ